VKANGNITTYQQQWRLLRNKNVSNPDPRAQHLKDLTIEIKKWKNKNCEIILMWDANETITLQKSKLHQFLYNNNLAPIHNILPTASYARGSICIDFIMATPKIPESITKTGYTSFFGGIWTSDHRGIYVDLCTNSLFHGTTPHIHTAPKRLISSSNMSQVFRFTKALQDATTLPPLLQSLQGLARKITWESNDHEQFEHIDASFTKILLKAESTCHIPNNAAWHPELDLCYFIYAHHYSQHNKQEKSN
jgi:hypothetical protein